MYIKHKTDSLPVPIHMIVETNKVITLYLHGHKLLQSLFITQIHTSINSKMHSLVLLLL